MRVELEVRLADATDMKLNDNKLRIGQVYFLKSLRTGKMEGVYQLSRRTNPFQIKEWLDNEMIYVPAEVMENEIIIK